MNNLPQKYPTLKHKLITAITAATLAILILPGAQIMAQTTPVVNVTATTTSYTLPNSIFTVPEGLKATSVVIYDPIAKSFIYEKNADEIRPIASLVKIMTAIVVKDIQTQFKTPPKNIFIKKIVPETKFDRTLKVGEKWAVTDLLRMMMITSSNTAAETFAKEIIPRESFISLMNFKAKSFGFNTIKTSSPSGLPDKKMSKGKTLETPTAFGSARDIAKLMALAYEKYPELITFSSEYKATFNPTLNNIPVPHVATSTNELLATLPDLIGGKTGFTDASGGNLAVILKSPSNTPVIIVVLGSTIDGRFLDTIALASSTRNFYAIK